MNRKQLIIILVALVVIGGAGLLVLNKNKESLSQPAGKQGEKLLPNFQVNDVASIRLKKEQEINLVRKDDGWGVQERGGFPASFQQISEFLLKMSDMKITQSEPIAQNQLARMELTEPGAGKTATLLEFKDSKGAVLYSILLGKRHSREGGQINRVEDFSDGRYVLMHNDLKNLLLIPDALINIDPKADHWIDRDFIQMEKPKSVALSGTNSWKLSRATETNDWVLADAKAGEVLDKNKASSLTSTLGNLSFMDAATDAQTGRDKASTVTVETFDHFTYVLKFGAKTAEGNSDFSYTVSAEIPKERVAGKDEKPEDKAKLDKEFQDKNKQLQDKLTKEKKGEKWVYVVSSWVTDALLKDRAQLFEEKKEEKKEGAPAAVSAPVKAPPVPTPAK